MHLLSRTVATIAFVVLVAFAVTMLWVASQPGITEAIGGSLSVSLYIIGAMAAAVAAWTIILITKDLIEHVRWVVRNYNVQEVRINQNYMYQTDPRHGWWARRRILRQRLRSSRR